MAVLGVPIDAAFNALMNVGALVGVSIQISDAVKAAKPVPAVTNVEIGAGLGPNGEKGDFGGAQPALALWNVRGERIGQYMPKKGDTIPAGTASAGINVKQDQGANGQPEYLLITTVDPDAICITYVSVAGSGVNWNWIGDIGYTCGGDWYPSTAKFGDANYQPKCSWIDADHSDGLRFIAMSMHMPDFNGDVGLTDEYNKNPDALCNSKARFMQWGQLSANPGQNSNIPIFDPPLKYNTNGSDVDMKAIFKPGTVRYKRDEPLYTNSTVNNDNSINRPGHVIISDYNAHSATEVCESDTSRGPSFVSTQDGFYCDMSTKTSYPLCDDTVKNSCFDVDTKQLIGKTVSRRHAKHIERREVHKQYKTHDRWTPEE